MSQMSRILVVEDEVPILKALGANLRARGYEPALATTGEEALIAAAGRPPDAVLLDLGLPGMSGLDVIEGLRGWTNVPIVVLSARGSERDKVAALDAGADDYVTKPFGMDELFARLRAALRRTSPAGEAAVVSTPDFVVDLAAKVVTRDGTEVRLTPTEWGIVELLVRNPDKLVSQRQLLQDVWGPQYGEETNYLRVHLAHIRRKLEPEPGAPHYFITEPGMGYRFKSPNNSRNNNNNLYNSLYNRTNKCILRYNLRLKSNSLNNNRRLPHPSQPRHPSYNNSSRRNNLNKLFILMRKLSRFSSINFTATFITLTARFRVSTYLNSNSQRRFQHIN